MEAIVLKKVVLLYWALWLSAVFLLNVFDGLRVLGLLPRWWRLFSGNYALIVRTTRVYHCPGWLTAGLFVGVIAWQALAAVLLWRAVGVFQGVAVSGMEAVYAAFGVSLALWAAFTLVNEILVNYRGVRVHMQIFATQLASLLAVGLLPDR